ncbi:MAG: translation initiation factor 4A-III [Homavirus sp.]|uniref:RNA helicase n=1 Tax=Homavirus sp. TaxID=2487769 RepID=A0A3G5A738_9VIRU|nr:MAG: translation initiation factor 4A-III [Homavirus sp.]
MNDLNEDKLESTNIKDIKDTKDTKDTDYATSFEDMNLKESLLRGIFGYGFEKPSEIQSKAIIPITNGRDIIAQSQSGTGKTGAFVISALQRTDNDGRGCQAIILVPTRELAIQIKDVCLHLGQYCKIKPVLCVGGSNIQESRRDLDNGPVIVIGTPGRIVDMIQRRYLSVRSVRMLILDEADEMLSPSFASQIRGVVDQLSSTAQICLFSATMTEQVIDIAKQIMHDPKIILIKPEELTLEGIKQFYINVGSERYKLDTFCDIYDRISVSQSIVYVNTKRRADELKDILTYKKFTVSVIHSELSPADRTYIIKQFRSGETRILISTDLLSRGIDVQQVSIVINYDLPNNKECYIHRIGRSGRFGRKGVAINLVTERDFYKIRDLERSYATTIDEMPDHISDMI